MAGPAAELYSAAEAGDLEGLRACLAACHEGVPALPDVESPLHAAARRGHANCVEALLSWGHDANRPSWGPLYIDCGWRPLHSAASAGQSACVGALLAARADPEARAGDGSTPLYWAAEGCHVDCVAALLAAGASPAAVCGSHSTPTHVAAARGHAQVLRLLLAARPDAAWQRAEHSGTPVDVALTNARLEAASCLLTLGSKQQTCDILALLGRHIGKWRQPLYASLAARQALTAAEWAHVPMPCAGIGAALPAVLQRSEAEASLLVCHLAPAVPVTCKK